jgi:hypothetical protein
MAECHDTLDPLHGSGNHRFRPRAWFGIEQVVGGLQVTRHENSRHNCRRSGHPGRGCRPIRGGIIISALYTCLLKGPLILHKQSYASRC